MTEPTDAVTISVVMKIDPITFKEDNLAALSHQFAGWIVNNMKKMTEPKGSDLFVALVCSRGDQKAGCQYRDGQFVPDEGGAW